MEVRQARHFLAIVASGSIGQAAETLHITQPALSQSVVALERGLRTQLFTRSARGMHLTLAGEALVSPARRLLDASLRAVAAVEQCTDGPWGDLHIASMPGFAASPVSEWICRFRDRYPHVTVHLGLYGGHESVEKHLEVGPAELVVAQSSAAASEATGRVDVGYQRMIVGFPPGTEVPDDAAVTIEQISGCSFIVSDARTPMRRVLEKAFQDAGHELKVAVESSCYEAWTVLVAGGAGSAILPAQDIDLLHGLGVVTRDLAVPLGRQVSFFYQRERLSYAGQAFVKAAVRAVAGFTPPAA